MKAVAVPVPSLPSPDYVFLGGVVVHIFGSVRQYRYPRLLFFSSIINTS